MISPEHDTASAIMIAIKNQSGKIGNRFSFRNPIPIFMGKSVSDFDLKIDLRLKTVSGTASTDGT